MSFLIRVAIALWVSTASWGQERDFTLRVEVPVATVDVSVTTPEGTPVLDLLADDFRVLDNGVEQPLRYFGPTAAPYHVYLLLDTSGSITGQESLMTSVVTGFLESLRPHDRVAVGVFDQDVLTLVDWDDPSGGARERIRGWSRGRQTGGTTRFYRSLGQILEEGFDDIGERRAVVVLTDGRDASLYQELQQRGRLLEADSDPPFLALMEAAGTSHVAVYFVALNTDLNLQATSGGNEYRSLRILYPNSDMADRYLEQVRIRMERIAGLTGGEVFLPGTSEDVVEFYARIARDLGRAYSLGWNVPADASDSERTIRIQISNPGYRVRTSRSSYQPVRSD